MALILQIGYYAALSESRQMMLEQAGHKVISALGNDQVMAIAGTYSFDLAIVGPCAPEVTRRTIIRWLKQHLPHTRIVALLANDSEELQGADCVALSQDPDLWLNRVAECANACASSGH